MTTRVDYADLPPTIKAAYDPTFVKRISKRTTKAGEGTYTVETYKGTHRWRHEATGWRRVDAED